MWQGWSCGLVHYAGGNATDPIWRVLASSQGISSKTPLRPQHSNPNPNPNPLTNQLWCIDFLTPPHLSSSLTDFLSFLNLLCHTKTDARFMQDASKAVWSILYVCVAFSPSLKQDFIVYRSSKVSRRPDCIFEIHQLRQSGFSRVYSNCCCVILSSADSCRNIHIYADAIIKTNAMIKTQEDFFIKIYTSHFIARVRKGCSGFAYERELETEHKLQYFDLSRLNCHVVFLVSWCPTGGLGVHSAGCWLSLLHLISIFSGPQTPSGFPRAPLVRCGFPYHISSPTVWNSPGNCATHQGPKALRPDVAFPTTSRFQLSGTLWPELNCFNFRLDCVI